MTLTRVETSMLGPSDASSNNLYVSPTGGGNGLSPETPMTLTEARDRLRIMSPLRGFWTVNLAAGAYSGANATLDYSQIKSMEPVQISGATVAHNSEPTTVIDRNGFSANSGWLFQDFANVILRDLQFENWDTTTQTSAVEFRQKSIARLQNIRVVDSNFGVTFRDTEFDVIGGQFSGCGTGVFALANSSGNIRSLSGSVATGTTFTNCDYGIRAWEGATFHADWGTFLDSTFVAIYAQEGAKVTAQYGGNFERNPVCFRADVNAYVTYDDATVTLNQGTAAANTVVSQCNSGGVVVPTGEQVFPTVNSDQAYIAGSVSHTGDTAKTSLWTRSIPAGAISTRGAGIRGIVRGFFAGAGTKTLTMELNGASIGSHTSSAGSTATFELEFAVMHGSNTAGALAQRNRLTFTESSVAPIIGGTATAVDMAEERNLILYTTHSDAAGEITITEIYADRVGW